MVCELDGLVAFWSVVEEGVWEDGLCALGLAEFCGVVSGMVEGVVAGAVDGVVVVCVVDWVVDDCAAG